MLIIRSLLLILVLCVCVQAQRNCQYDSPMAKKLTTALKVKAPEWQLTDKSCNQGKVEVKIRGQEEEKQVTYEFIGLQYGERPFVSVIAYSSDSLEYIQNEYENSKNGMLPSSKPTVLSEVVGGLGDENYTWQSRDGTELGVTFRKGKVLMILAGSSMTLSKMFAQYLESEL